MKKSVYEKIEKIYAQNKEQEHDEPQWVKELKAELKEIKLLLKDVQNPRRNKRKNQDYFNFVNALRKRLKADTVNEVYPEVHYHGKRIGANLKGHLYDKATAKSLPAQEAFALYEYFYAQKEEIESFVVVN